MKTLIAASTALVVVAGSLVGGMQADAFCGFYVSGSNKKMFADASNVVLMRHGTKTVLSMQNDYRGPLEDFAMVVPVPVVLKEGDVKVVPKVVLDRVDSLGSPRLVEYWEQDPCPAPEPMRRPKPAMAKKAQMEPMESAPSAPSAGRASVAFDEEEGAQRMAVPPILASFSASPSVVTSAVATDVMWSFQYSNEPWPTPSCTVDHGVGRVSDGGASKVTISKTTEFTLTCANSAGKASRKITINAVTVEAKYDVAEYQIVILSATEATGLEKWLTLNNYKIPADAEPLLRPYVETGSKFFVAKVDPTKVQMVDGHASLSPLRFHYDSEEFSLPIRLGMANSPGTQDLIVNILSPDKRYEVTNYKNVTIPTNFDVKPTVKTRFAEFYAALFDKTIARNPGAVVTEYAWTATGGRQQVMQPGRPGRPGRPMMIAGGGMKCDPCPEVIPDDADMITLGGDIIGGPINRGNYVLTRLHARYRKKDMKDDLRFKEATPITGGREVWNAQGLEYGASPSSANFFQARYALRHWWTGKISCKNPKRGVWGGPPDGRVNNVIAASKAQYAPRGKLQLASVIGRDLWEIGFKKARPAPKIAPPTTPTTPKVQAFGVGALGALVVLGLLRRRRRA
ncbi:MAG: hypothetical protein JWP01_2939 [Myxococcales bacterium]|nr:hypothetical protein [Myxococcales bacterium]